MIASARNWRSRRSMEKRRDGNRRATDLSTLLAILAWRGYDAVGHFAFTAIRIGDDRMLLAQAAANSTTIVTQSGIGLGSVIAIVCSWQRNRSILWAILAGILSGSM